MRGVVVHLARAIKRLFKAFIEMAVKIWLERRVSGKHWRVRKCLAAWRGGSVVKGGQVVLFVGVKVHRGVAVAGLVYVPVKVFYSVVISIVIVGGVVADYGERRHLVDGVVV